MQQNPPPLTKARGSMRTSRSVHLALRRLRGWRSDSARLMRPLTTIRRYERNVKGSLPTEAQTYSPFLFSYIASDNKIRMAGRVAVCIWIC